MASRGDTVECTCGAFVRLENDRIPWHKKPGTRFNCHTSGVPAENWVPVKGKPITFQGMTLSCPECKSRYHIRNAPSGSSYPLACGACGTFGTLEEFLAEAMAKTEPRRHRYVG